MPAALANQWVEVTTPKVPRISGRVVNMDGGPSFTSSRLSRPSGGSGRRGRRRSRPPSSARRRSTAGRTGKRWGAGPAWTSAPGRTWRGAWPYRLRRGRRSAACPRRRRRTCRRSGCPCS
ncbi:hypothetical protein G6F22_019940 [Rhizopus arrhizus]|nr:hypothetical protein G6F22_019940 [Rhizopus arrhizus]KAG1383338.1 hypothetical protein G6F59_017798 [Rhizopus arrhizus]